MGADPAALIAAVAGSVDGVMAFDVDLRYTLWNPAMERISGMRAHDVVGQRAPELFPFLVETGEETFMRRALAGESSSVTDRPFVVLGTGRSGVLEAHYSPIHDAAGQVTGGLGIVRDMTERRSAELALRETETRFRHMADVAPVLLWMAGRDAQCNFFNQTWLEFTGRPLEDELGVGWAEGVHFEDLQRCLDTYVDAFNRRERFEMEYRLRRADGEYRWILDRGIPRQEPDGSFAGYIGSCVDITERKRLESDLRAAVALRDEFLSVASHELRTPLAALQLQLDSLIRMIDRPAETARLRAKSLAAQEQAVRLTELVGVLLDVSRVAMGRLEIAREPVDLGEVARAVVQRFLDAATRAGSSITVAAAAVVGQWDRTRLEQVATNLVSNAIKYGAGAPVHVRVESDGDHAQLVVADRGIGIAPEVQPRIFERFERGVTSRHYGGLGLGLWITREIVHALGGAIAVASTAGEGATFTVRLPLLPPPDS